MIPWTRILGPVIGIAVIFLIGFQVATWRANGKIEKLKGERSQLIRERDQALLDVAAVKARLEDMRKQRNDADKRYLDAVNKPPEIVTEYRDRWKTVTETIVSEDCQTGVAELFEFIHDLPERPQ
jgi:hypothetical protein